MKLTSAGGAIPIANVGPNLGSSEKKSGSVQFYVISIAIYTIPTLLPFCSIDVGIFWLFDDQLIDGQDLRITICRITILLFNQDMCNLASSTSHRLPVAGATRPTYDLHYR